jgi:hypothetical protein
MSLSLTWKDPLNAVFHDGPRELAHYQAQPEVPANESPRPCLHPVFTLAGLPVTDFRPADHPWHQGISWAFTYIDGDTFWGGPTYRRATAAYEWLDNHGTQVHLGWEPLPGGECGFLQHLEWRSSARAPLLAETRRITAHLLHPTAWALRFHSRFTNLSGHELLCTSPVGQGRPEGGYFGLMWRGHPTWAQGRIHLPTGESPSAMGLPSPWLAYERPASAPGGPAVLLLRDDPRNPRHPTTWFERHAEQPLASFAFAYREPFAIAPAATFELRHEMIFCDGAWPEIRPLLGLPAD